MEAFGFGMSVVSVIGAFQNCLKLYGDIISIRDRDEDVRAYCMLVQIEMRTFQRIYAILGQEPTLASCPTSLYQGILQWMQDDLKRIYSLSSRHVSTTTINSSLPTANPSCAFYDDSLRILSDDGSKPNQNAKGIKRLARSVTWVAGDKARLEKLVTRLNQWNNGLTTLLPEARRQRISYETISETIASRSIDQLESVERATFSQYPTISHRARVKSMTLRSRGTLSSPEQTLMSRSRFKLSQECFKWLPKGSKNNRNAGQISAATIMNISLASSQERAFALYRPKQGEGIGSHGSIVEPMTVLVEWRDNFRSEESIKQFEYRLDYLVEILRKMSGHHSDREEGSGINRDFSIFPCLGWITTSALFDRIGLVFSLPHTAAVGSIVPKGITSTSTSHIPSLHDRIIQTRREKLNTPALGQRFSLAYHLAITLKNLLDVGWVHKEFRSHNILFITEGAEGNSALTRPYLSGFTYARPSSNNAQDLSLLNSNPTYDLYRPSHHVMFKHQQRQLLQRHAQAIHLSHDSITQHIENSSRIDASGRESSTIGAAAEVIAPCWTSAMDIYGLGIILLEIGLWRTIESLKGAEMSKVDFVDRVLDNIVDSLSYRMGELYQGVVRRCLRLGDWVDNEEDLKTFFADAVENLALCRA